MVSSLSSTIINWRRLMRPGSVSGLALLAAVLLGQVWPASAAGSAFPRAAILTNGVSITTTHETSPGNAAYEIGVAAREVKPLGVILAAFGAQSVISQSGHYNLIAWETASELNVLGFNLWRGVSPDEPTERLNEFVIPSQAPGSAEGGIYRYDDLNVASEVVYYYWLEDVDFNGEVARHGPVVASGDVPTAVTLTDLQANSRTASLPWPMAVLAGILCAGWVLDSARTRSIVRQLSQNLKQRSGHA